MTKTKHTERVTIPTFVMAFASVAHTRRFMRSETSSFAMCGHFFCSSFEAGMRGGASRHHLVQYMNDI